MRKSGVQKGKIRKIDFRSFLLSRFFRFPIFVVYLFAGLICFFLFFFYQNLGSTVFYLVPGKFQEKSKDFPRNLATGRQPGQINLQVGVHKLPIFVEDFPKDFFHFFRDVFFPDHFGKKTFGKSSTQIGNLCTPTYKFIWPGCLPVASPTR